jgi:hypothetical protein
MLSSRLTWAAIAVVFFGVCLLAVAFYSTYDVQSFTRQDSRPSLAASPRPVPTRSLVYWVPILAAMPPSNTTNVSDPTKWWAEGLHVQLLSLASAILSESDAGAANAVHFLIASNVDTKVLKNFILQYFARALPGVPQSMLDRIIYTWEIPPRLMHGYADLGCAMYALRGEIFAYPRLHRYRHVLYLDGDVLVKRPLSTMFAEFSAFLLANPAERHKLHVIPEAAVFINAKTVLHADWLFFMTGKETAEDLANRSSHHLRPFNGGIMLYELNPTMLSAFAEVQLLQRAATLCGQYGDQPCFNNYFGQRLMSSWQFMCAYPNVSQLEAMAAEQPEPTHDYAAVGQSFANAQCGLNANRAFFYNWKVACQVPFKVNTHTLVHFVSSGVQGSQKKLVMMRYLTAYFGNRTLTQDQFEALWAAFNMPPLIFYEHEYGQHSDKTCVP